MNCRFCNTALEYQILDLGDQPSANRLLPLSYVEQHDRAVDKPPFPLQVYLCEACKLVQLGETEMPEILFTDDYVYYSSYSRNWVEHAQIGRAHV